MLQAGGPKLMRRRKALATFSEAYWPPLYTFVRRRGYSPADAQDIVQGFFEQLLEQNTLSRRRSGERAVTDFLAGVAGKFFAQATGTDERD